MKPLITIVTLVLLTSGVVAQTNFSGTWAIKEKQTSLGPEYVNALATSMKVQQNKDSLIIESVSTGADNQESKNRVAVPMNGQSVSNMSPASGRKVSRSLKWSADKKVLTITSPIAQAGNENEIELTRIDTWTLSADGKELIFNRKSVETVSESWEVKGVFVKQ